MVTDVPPVVAANGGQSLARSCSWRLLIKHRETMIEAN